MKLTEKKCKACEGGVLPLTKEQANGLLSQIQHWQLQDSEFLKISRLFEFKNYYHTMAFVNAVAWVSHQENHHPDLEVGYNTCLVRYYTHSIKGLSENDFICAAKVNSLCDTF